MKARRRLSTCLVLATALSAGSVWAASQPAHLRGRLELESASGPDLLQNRRISRGSAPAARARAWRRFESAAGGTWLATWNDDTKIPQRVYGTGIAAPGASASAARAESQSRALLGAHLELFAPGSNFSDFFLAANQVGPDGVRTVAFYQRARGMRVVGGQLSVRIIKDRIVVVASEALPNVDPQGQRLISDETARGAAAQWIQADFRTAPTIIATGATEILPLFEVVRHGSATLRYRPAVPVVISTRAPIGKWTVWIDAETGAALARRQMLRFATADLLYNTPVRWPGGPRADYPASRVELGFGESKIIADESGVVEWIGGTVIDLVVGVVGPLVEVNNDAGDRATAIVEVTDNGQAVWQGEDQFVDAQITTFVHSNRAKDWLRIHNPELPWLDEVMPTTVNINEACNAFSDGNSTNFFRASRGCANTGRLPDVVYHEFGHSMHAQSLIPGAGEWDGALSEGIGDVLAATIQGSADTGKGFFNSEEPLRHIDPPDTEYIYPQDITGQVHQDGMIFGSTMWDLRKAFIEELGERQGVELHDRIFYGIVQRASDIPSSYVEALVTDDDDGDLGNGTPHICTINRIFGDHGLADNNIGGLATLGKNFRNGYDVGIEVLEPAVACDGAPVRANLNWELRDFGSSQSIAMDLSDGAYTASLPGQAAGRVVRYQIEVEYEDGVVRRFPENPADPFYEFFIGETQPLYCNDFELADPFTEGWTHGLSRGEPGEGADDWAWGPLRSPSSSGDPELPFSGQFAMGNDIGGDNRNGSYQPDKTNFAMSPVIEVGSATNVRLQYRRWLNVEDGNFDRASIMVNDQEVWANLNSQMGADSDTHHTDKEWRFHDVDISDQVVNGQVQVQFQLASDGGTEFGGWTIDDFCVVAYSGGTCGNGVVENNEFCDDGNDIDDDDCSNACVIKESGGGGCRTAGGSAPAAIFGLFVAIVLLRRRR